MDINTKKLKKNAFRVSKVRGLTASRVRVPGGCCNADVMQQVVDIAKKYGYGQIHLTTRQGFEIEGIHMEDMDKVNKVYAKCLSCFIDASESRYGDMCSRR